MPRPAWLPPDDQLRAHFAPVAREHRYRVFLTQCVAAALPADGPCSIIDVGAGDGYVGALLQRVRPDTTVVGVETFVRRTVYPGFALAQFDGVALPFPDRAFDCAVVLNVLHHARRPSALFCEILRVTRSRVIIKDHIAETRYQRWQLACLDQLGNRRFGSDTVGDYWTRAQWDAMFAAAARVRDVAAHTPLAMRTGLLRAVFGNHLEVLFVLDLDG